MHAFEHLTEKPALIASHVAPEASNLAPDASDLAPDASDLVSDASNLAPDGSVLAPDASDHSPDASVLAPDASDLVSDASDLAPNASNLDPDASDLVPDASNLAPDASHLAPEVSDLAPDASDLVPDASDLVPDASDLVPDASDLVPDASDLAADASDLARDASDLTPDASNLVPDASGLALYASNLGPGATDLTPDASNLVLDASNLVPDASDLAPEADDLAPDGSVFAPDANDLVADGSDLAANSRDLALKANDLAPEAVDLSPDASVLAPDGSNFAPDDSDLPRVASNLDLDTKIDKFKLDGNKAFQEDCLEEALDTSSFTINLAQGCNKPFYLSLFTKRSMDCTLEEWENALKDANDYITRRPYSWKGYALKALALDGLNKEGSADLKDNASAEIAAALAFYYNRVIFTNFPNFVEFFPDLQSRIFICDSVDELLDAMFSQEVETGLLKILVLGSEEYILNSETVDKRWNNCILVGTRKNCFVSLKSNYNISLLKCMLTNLSFSFNECQLHCLPDSLVKILNCNFTSCDDDRETIKTEGIFIAEQCSFTRSPLVCSKQSRALVHDCWFCDSAKYGLRVNDGGTLKVENSRIYNNGGHGLIVQSSECIAVSCDIHDNGYDGIIVNQSKNVSLIHNNVYNNNGNGIRMYESPVDVKKNNLLYQHMSTQILRFFVILTVKIVTGAKASQFKSMRFRNYCKFSCTSGSVCPRA